METNRDFLSKRIIMETIKLEKKVQFKVNAF